MKSTYKTLALLVVLLLFAGFSQAGEESQTLKASKSGIVSLGSGTMVGGTLLPKGDYQVRCDHRGAGHALVFRKVTRLPGRAQEVGDEVARAQCTMEDLGRKAEVTSVRSEQDSSGNRKVREILVRGEKVRHLFD